MLGDSVVRVSKYGKKISEKEAKQIDSGIEEINDLVKQIEELSTITTNELKNTTSDIGPKVSEMTQMLSKLDTKNMFTPDTDDDSDTIEDEPYEYYISDTLKEIWDIVEATPNNMELGKKVRSLYYEKEEAAPDPIERAATTMKEDEMTENLRQMELFDEEDSQENPDQLNLFSDTKE